MVPRYFAGPGSSAAPARRLSSSRRVSGLEQASAVGGAPVGREGHAEMGEGRRRGYSASGCALEEALLQEVGLVDVFHRLGLLPDGDGQGRQADGRAAEGAAEGGEDAAVDLVEAPLVDLEQPEGL